MILKRKYPIFLLAVLFIIGTIMAGCGPTNPDTTDTMSTPDTSVDFTLPEPGEVELPLTEEPVTLTAFYPMTSESLQVLNDWGDNEGHKELERRTGVRIEWQNPVVTQAAERFNMIVNSGDFPDMFLYDFGPYPGGLVGALNDGLVIDVKDLVDRYAPNYRVLRETNDIFRRESMTDDGRLPGFYMYHKADEGTNPWGGFMIRKDWLDDLGLSIPVTFDDWYNTLTAFRDEKGARSPLIMAKTGLFFMNELIAGYGVGGLDPFYQVDGEVKFGPLEPGYKEYIAMVKKWYEEGLIGEDFMTQQNPFYAPNASMIANNQTGIFWAASPLVKMYYAMASDPDFELAPILSPVKNEGDTLKFNPFNVESYAGVGVVISATSKYPELIARWCDYQYTDEGYLLSNFGIEGESYEMIDGKPFFKQSVLDDPNGIVKYVYRYGATIYDMHVEFEQIVTDDLKEFYYVWGEARGDYLITGTLTPTVDETERSTAIMADLATLIEESTLNFIIGEKPLDEFDSFVQTLINMGVEEAIEIKQAQMDRFEAR